MAEKIFRRLQERLDKYSLGFPATESGIELEILQELFSEEDAAMFLELTPQLESPESVAERLDRPVNEVAEQLEDMSQRGLLFRLCRGDSCKYGAIAFVHGLMEFQVARLGQRLAEMMEQYVLAFSVKKPDETISHTNCSAGERKIIKCFSTLLNKEYKPQIILVDNVEMHVDTGRHLELVRAMKRCFPDSQIF